MTFERRVLFFDWMPSKKSLRPSNKEKLFKLTLTNNLHLGSFSWPIRRLTISSKFGGSCHTPKDNKIGHFSVIGNLKVTSVCGFEIKNEIIVHNESLSVMDCLQVSHGTLHSCEITFT